MYYALYATLFIGVVVAIVILYVQVYNVQTIPDMYIVDSQFDTNQTLPVVQSGVVLLRGQTNTAENGIYYEGLLGSPVYNWPDQVSVTVLDDNEQVYFRRFQTPQWTAVSTPPPDVTKEYVDTQIAEVRTASEAYTDMQIAARSEYYYISTFSQDERGYVNYITLAGHPSGEYKVDFFDTSSGSGPVTVLTEGDFGVTVTANDNFLAPQDTKLFVTVNGAGRFTGELFLHESDTDTADPLAGTVLTKFTDFGGSDGETWTANLNAIITSEKYFWVRLHLTPPGSEDDVYLFSYSLLASPT